jgi:proline dehydrogenase
MHRECAAALRRLARDSRARAAIRNSPALASALAAAASRYIAGPDRQAALERSLELARIGVLVSLEFMGEDTLQRADVNQATREFLELMRECNALRIPAGLSLNLSHIGLAIDPALALENCERILTTALPTATEVILNMEGDAYRQGILDVYWALGPRFPILGITLQACLARTPDDLARALTFPGRIRLVKGAYDELSDGAIRNERVNARYREMMDRLLASGHRCSIATHDQALINHAVVQVDPGAGVAEFEMLFGVAEDRLLVLRDLGFQVRIYLPYGREWLLYLCHRLAEHPPNLYPAVKALIDQFQTALRASQSTGT